MFVFYNNNNNNNNNLLFTDFMNQLQETTKAQSRRKYINFR